MPSERVSRWIDQMLAEADAAAAEHRWMLVRRNARSVLAYAPDDARAQAHLRAAEQALAESVEPAAGSALPLRFAAEGGLPVARAAQPSASPRALRPPVNDHREPTVAVHPEDTPPEPRQPDPAETIDELPHPRAKPESKRAGNRALLLLTREVALFTVGMGVIGLVEVLSPSEAPGAAAPTPVAVPSSAAPISSVGQGGPVVASSALRDPTLEGGNTATAALDSTQDFTGWPTRYGWTPGRNELRNDGSDFGDANWVGGLWNARWIHGADPPSAKSGDYAIEAEIRVLERPVCGSFGIVAGEAYQVGAHFCSEYGKPVLSIRSSAPELLVAIPFDPAPGWHVYRVELSKGMLRTLVDGVELASIDNVGPPESRVAGLWSDHTELVVRAVRVVDS